MLKRKDIVWFKLYLEIYTNMFSLYLGLLCDLLWSDPDKEVTGWGENDRGVSYTFGQDIVAKYLHKHDFDLICRAHQVSFLKIFPFFNQLYWTRALFEQYFS